MQKKYTNLPLFLNLELIHCQCVLAKQDVYILADFAVRYNLVFNLSYLAALLLVVKIFV
jgi:hypothetical protein